MPLTVPAADTSLPAANLEPTGAALPPTDQSAAEVQLPPAIASPELVQRLHDGFDGASETDGDLLFLFGEVLDVNGNVVPNIELEIWQTDAAGVYDHPGDPSTDYRDQSFQFFGATTVDADGWYTFRTIVPGRYEPRPCHIHYKVKQGNKTLLTSQFYFSDDIAVVQGEGGLRSVGESEDLLLLQLVQSDVGLLANGRIVVETGIGAGSLPLTPAQPEGPYYPVVSPDEYDNDLARLP